MLSVMLSIPRDLVVVELEFVDGPVQSPCINTAVAEVDGGTGLGSDPDGGDTTPHAATSQTATNRAERAILLAQRDPG
jgi:hypothetical protein